MFLKCLIFLKFIKVNNFLEMTQVRDMEVIELMSDDEENSNNVKSKVYNSCINFKCRSGINMKLAPSFACAYYGVTNEKKKKKKRMICKECFYTALRHQKVILINFLKINNIAY